MEDKISRNIAEFLLDFFDVDIQLSYVRIIEKLKDTPKGERLSAWAQANPMAFEALVRLLSMLASKVPKNNSVLTQTISDHIRRLPREIRGTFLGYSNGSNVKQTVFRQGVPSDEAFQKRYSEALDGLSEDDLVQVIGLNRNQLIEWVDTPIKLRPYLLKKWHDEVSEDPNDSFDSRNPSNPARHKFGRTWNERIDNFAANKRVYKDSQDGE